MAGVGSVLAGATGFRGAGGAGLGEGEEEEEAFSRELKIWMIATTKRDVARRLAASFWVNTAPASRIGPATAAPSHRRNFFPPVPAAGAGR
ncbi:hypothetical protein, partial [Zavarzinella formosa]|uniref:hypothetical protein n=1 Tax=Zavarzinella formosa TaxID=360055 RepID=UPI0012F9993F